MEIFSTRAKGILFCARARVCKYSGVRLIASLAVLLALIAPAARADDTLFQTAAKNVNHQDLGIALNTIDQLGRSHDERAVAILATAFAKEARPAARRAMIDALGLLRQSSARPTLIQALKDSEPQVRQSAVIALEAVGGKESDDALIQQASLEHDLAVKTHLVQILGRSNHPKAADKLKVLAEDDNDTVSQMAQDELDKKAKNAKK